MAQMIVRRPTTTARPPAVSTKQIASVKLAETWCMFDTQVLSASAVAPATAAFNFAAYTATIPFFTTRTVANASAALTSMNNIGYVDHPFKAYGCGVEVHCDIDATTAAAVATAQAFVETVTMYSAIVLSFGGDTKLIEPVSDLPCGGGVLYGNRTDTRAAAANQLAGSASNGKQSAESRVMFQSPILFLPGPQASFAVNLVTSPGAVTRIQALTALSGNFQATIRIKFWGERGKGLLPGTSQVG